MSERLVMLEDLNALRLGVLCNFPQVCGDEKSKEAANTIVAVENELKEYRALGTVEGLAELVKAKNEGRLVVLPCKVGDFVYTDKRCWHSNYWYLEFNPYIKCEVVNFKKCKTGIKMYLRPLTRRTMGTRCHKFFSVLSFGRTVFLTREEAEAKLKEEQIK